MLIVENKTENLIQLGIDENSKQALAEPFFSEGCRAQERGRNAKAIKLYDKALSCWPRCAKAWMNKGEIYLSEERYRIAEVCFRKGLEIEPKFFLLHSYLAMALEAQDKDNEAREHYREAITLRTDEHAENYLDLVRVCLKLDDLQEAEKQCRLANNCPDAEDSRVRAEILSTMNRIYEKKFPRILGGEMSIWLNAKNHVIMMQK